MSYRPSGAFTTPLVILRPTYTTKSGVTRKTYPTIEQALEDKENNLIFGSFRTFGGTETQKNGLLVVEKTAIVETWYRPDILGSENIALVDKGKIYEIVGEPEDIEERHQFLKFKVKYTGGGV